MTAKIIVDENGAMTHVNLTDGVASEADIQDAADRTGWSVEKIKAILG